MNTRSLIALAVVVLAGCSQQNQEASAPSNDLAGTSWRLEDLAGAGVIDSTVTLEFIDAGKVAGHAPCNRFFGTVEVSGDSIKFGPIGSTKMACLDTLLMKEEAMYLQTLQDAVRFQRDGSALLVYSKGSDQPLRFVPASP